MPDYIPLTDKEIARLARYHYENIVPFTEAQERPTIMLVGGQPGAGKTTATETATAELYQKGGVIHVDADVFHLQINNIKKDQFTTSQTHEDCKKIAMRVRDYAFEGKRNILEEGLFRHHDSLSSLAERAHKYGYTCEIIAIATSREQSRLSVLERREVFRDTFGYVRDVPESKQDAGYEGITENLLKDGGKLDRVRVMDRAGALLYDSAGGGQCRSVYEGLEKGRSLSDEQVASITKQWEALRQACVDKRIPKGELARVDEAIMLFDGFKSAERHRHGMRTLEKNYKALAADPRYGKHTEAELTKAAFYRGAVEKKQAFEGKNPDFAVIDSTFSNREILHKLPDIAEIEGLMLSRGEKAEKSRARDDGIEL